MPTEEEKKKKKYRGTTPLERLDTAYKAGRMSGGVSGPPNIAPVVDYVKRDVQNVAQSPFGRGVGAGINAAGRGLSNVWSGVGTGVEATGKFFGSPLLERLGRDARNYWSNPSTAQAAPPPVAARNELGSPPVTWQGRTSDGYNFNAPQTPQGTAQAKPTPNKPTPRGAMFTPPQPPVSEDYYSPERLRQLLTPVNGVPAWQDLGAAERPVEAIRGADRTYFDPKTAMEYGSVREALMGRAEPVRELEKERQVKLTQEELKNKGALERQKIATQGQRDVAGINAKTQKEIAEKSGQNKWIYQEPTLDSMSGSVVEPGFMYNQATGERMTDPQQITQAFAQKVIGAADKKAAATQFFSIGDDAIKEQVFRMLDPEKREYILKVLQRYEGNK